MGFRRGNEDEWEGWWEGASASASPNLHGKIEWEPSVDGGTEIDLLVSDLDVPDGDEVEVVWRGEVIMRAEVQGRSARKLVKSAEGGVVPRLADQRVELRHRGQVLAHAVLARD